MAKLTFILDDGETIEVPLHDSVTIGRADGNDVVVYDPRISSRHAELHFLADGKFEVRDLASKAGTYVNGERVERKMLGHGDQLSFGPLKGEFSTEVVAPADSSPAPGNGKQGDEPGVAAAPADEASGTKPGGEPKQKQEKSFLSSVLAAMGAKSVNGGKNAEAKGGMPERKADTAPAPAAKAKPGERPAAPKAAPGTPQAKAQSPPATPEKPAPAEPTPSAPTPAVQPAAKAPSAATPPGGTLSEAKVEKGAGDASKSDASQPVVPATSPKTPDAESKPVESKAEAPASPQPAVPAAPVGTPSPVEPKSEAVSAPEAGKPVNWQKSSRQEGKAASQDEPAKPEMVEEKTAEPAKVEKSGDGTVVIPVAKEAQAEAPKAKPEPVAVAQASVVESKAPQEKAEVASTPATPAVPPAPVPAATAAEASTLVTPVQGLVSPALLAPASSEVSASTSGPVPAPSKSTTPVKVAAGPALDQRIVNLVYNRLEGEAKEAITKLEERQKALDSEVTRLRDEIVRMQGERRGLAQEQVTLRESIQTETRDLETLRGQHKTADTQMQQLVANLRQGQERLDTLLAEEKQLSVVTSQLAETETRRDQVLKAIEEHTAEGDAKKAKLKEEIEGVATELEAKRVDFQAAMESMKLQAESARDGLATELEAKRVDIQAAMESMNLQAEAVRTDLQKSIDDSGKDADAKMTEIRAELDRVTEECTVKKAELLAGIDVLTKEEEFRQGEVQRLSSANSIALREFEAMASNKEQMGVQLLGLLKEQETHDARLIELRRQIADAEAQSRKVQELVEAREDQVKVAERRLQGIEQERTSLESSIRELTVSENRLKSLLPQLQESELREVALAAAVAALMTRQQECETQNKELGVYTLQLQEELSAFEAKSKETRTLLEANISELQQNKQSHSDDYDKFVAETNAVKTSLTEQRTTAEEELAKRQAELARESATLKETIAQRQELERQCNELAQTDKKLAEAKAGVQKTEAQRRELDTWIKELQSKRDASQKSLDGLHHEEEASRGRLEVLRGKEKDLRTELDLLAQKEQEDRVRFEELRRLTTEADREHEGHMEELARTVELTRRELADMEVKLAPLREWKESMDKRYARLASLPEDSAEARELWKEIEAEKAGLGQLIGTGGKGTRGVSLNESILRGMTGASGEGGAASEGVAGSETPAPGQRSGLKGRGKTKLHAPLGLTEGETPEERGNVGPAGTGAMLSGTGQEMALRARLNRLRESVQREATRLEFLRQERAREETRKTASSSNEPMLKEQERQVENKLRREEEKLATIERKIEIAEMEEEKRRERLSDLERKLTELKTDILEHERSRSEAVRKADIAAQAEARGTEDLAGRLRSLTEHEPTKSDKPASPPPSPEARPRLKTMGVPLPAPEPIDVPDSEKGMGELLLGQKPE